VNPIMPVKRRVPKTRNPLITDEAVELFRRGLELQALGADDLDDRDNPYSEEYNRVWRRLTWTILGLVGSAGPLDVARAGTWRRRVLAAIGFARARTARPFDEGTTKMTDDAQAARIWVEAFAQVVKGGVDPVTAADSMLTVAGLLVAQHRGTEAARLALQDGSDFLSRREQPMPEPGGGLH
jgi:hypothetical protein